MTNNKDLYNELRSYLHPNEEILWSGMPTDTRLPKRAMLPAVLAIFFMGFSLFWMAMASMAGGLFFLFGLPFFFVGAGLFYSMTAAQKKSLKRSLYAVTDTRAIILISNPRTGTNCKEYIFSRLSGVNLENVKGGVGTIRFEDVNVSFYESGRFRTRSNTAYFPERECTTAFVGIKDVHSVYHLISERIGK